MNTGGMYPLHFHKDTDALQVGCAIARAAGDGVNDFIVFIFLRERLRTLRNLLASAPDDTVDFADSILKIVVVRIPFREKIWLKYLRDFISLIGLLIALIITLSITSIAGSAQQMIISALYLDSIEWLKPAWHLIGLAISIFANYLLFFWIFWRLPRHRPRKKALIRGTFIAAIGFEVIKIIMTYTLPSLVKSPSGAAFGSVLGLMAFFYFFARLTLFCAAWIATAEYKDDPRMPGKTQR